MAEDLSKLKAGNWIECYIDKFNNGSDSRGRIHDSKTLSESDMTRTMWVEIYVMENWDGSVRPRIKVVSALWRTSGTLDKNYGTYYLYRYKSVVNNIAELPIPPCQHCQTFCLQKCRGVWKI